MDLLRLDLNSFMIMVVISSSIVIAKILEIEIVDHYLQLSIIQEVLVILVDLYPPH